MENTETSANTGAVGNASAANDSKSKRGGRVRGVANYTKAQCLAICHQVRAVLPLGQEGWEDVHRNYVAITTDTTRNVDSIKSKFTTLANSKKPTGDPTCPEEVRLAKQVRRELENKACIVDLGYNNSEDEEIQLIDKGQKTPRKDLSPNLNSPVTTEEPVVVTTAVISTTESPSSSSGSESTSSVGQKRGGIPQLAGAAKRAKLDTLIELSASILQKDSQASAGSDPLLQFLEKQELIRLQERKEKEERRQQERLDKEQARQHREDVYAKMLAAFTQGLAQGLQQTVKQSVSDALDISNSEKQ